MRAYSLDIRERVLKLCDEGRLTNAQIAERFKVGQWWVYKLKRQRRDRGVIAPLKGKVGQPRRLQAQVLSALKQYVAKHPDATLEEMAEHLKAPCTLPTIHNTLKRLGYRFKKNATGQRTRST